MQPKGLLSGLMSCLTAGLLLTGCDEKPLPEETIPQVFVVKASEQPYHPQRGFNAHIASRSDVDISAEVSGKVIAIHFKEGDDVSAGDPLFDIDPASYKAALARAKAELARAEANKSNAEKNFARGKKLVDDGYISASEYDTLEARELESIAAVESAKAALESARVNLEYTAIKAPQDGRVGRAKPSVGDLVNPSYGPLTTLVGKNDMEVVFQIPERLLLAAQRPDARITVKDIEVTVLMPDGREYAHVGTIHYFSNRVDASTGTVEVRAAIPNPDDILRPGLYVQALVRVKQPIMVLMIPQAAVQVDQRGTYVLAVDDTDTVTRINMVTGERVGENVLVNSGLDTGDRVIIRGVQKVRPGSPVKVEEYKPATEASTGSSTQ
ncbi:MAG: efflux RND transporter periplasmic adaptor subunit [Pseudomonadota bacterium]|nr:efflux RND transporter periplasmic adaptor subunit [Pseudomonadota bacterium]